MAFIGKPISRPDGILSKDRGLNLKLDLHFLDKISHEAWHVTDLTCRAYKSGLLARDEGHEAEGAYSNEAGRVSRSYVGHTFQLDRGHRSNLIAAR